jgi:hypothetical protein
MRRKYSTPTTLARRKPKSGRWHSDHKIKMHIYVTPALLDRLNSHWLQSDVPFFTTWINEQLTGALDARSPT